MLLYVSINGASATSSCKESASGLITAQLHRTNETIPLSLDVNNEGRIVQWLWCYQFFSYRNSYHSFPLIPAMCSMHHDAFCLSPYSPLSFLLGKAVDFHSYPTTVYLSARKSPDAALFTKPFLKNKSPFIPYPRGVWISSHKWKFFSNHCFWNEFLLVRCLVRWDLGGVFHLMLCLLNIVLHCIILWFHRERNLCLEMWYADVSWGI